METILIKALQLILSLSILVIVHECGHFIFAKIFKVRVEKFYLFFNPWFSLFKYKPQKSETEYGIGWLPLGGYVKIAGMIDESMDKAALAQPPQSWEFRTKPAWQRLLIMVGGVIMNFLLAFLIYSLMVFKWGDNYVPMDKTPLYFSQCAHQAGFQDGDILLKADGKTLTRYDDLDLFRVLSAKEVTVLRDGQEQLLSIPKDFRSQFLISKTPFTDFQSTRIDSLVPGNNAEKAGLKVGDKILSINGTDATAFGVFASELAKNKDSKVQLIVLRDQARDTIPVQVNADGQIGFTLHGHPAFVSDKYNFFTSFPAGIYLGIRKMHSYVLQLKLIFTKEGAQSLGGFGAIASFFPKQWDWPAFWSMTAFLSIILGIMNIIPIPALDGGHVMFLLYEVVSGRKPSDKFLERAQMVGMALLIALLLYANGMDVFRAITKQ
ncbi:MAG: RIP metalloprotease RseP [Dysgonamonadaceae bacterium]|jgi:regulator of sigma E protease|nr:RIP metalloprotease RseP [Dysgonamonadaceae bacterium]